MLTDSREAAIANAWSQELGDGERALIEVLLTGGTVKRTGPADIVAGPFRLFVGLR